MFNNRSLDPILTIQNFCRQVLAKKRVHAMQEERQRLINQESMANPLQSISTKKRKFPNYHSFVKRIRKEQLDSPGDLLISKCITKYIANNLSPLRKPNFSYELEDQTNCNNKYSVIGTETNKTIRPKCFQQFIRPRRKERQLHKMNTESKQPKFKNNELSPAQQEVMTEMNDLF